MDTQKDLLAQLFESTQSLHERFGDEWTLKDARDKFYEEKFEFLEAIKIIDDKDRALHVGDVQHAFEELIDTLVTMFSCLIRLGIPSDTARFYLQSGIEYVIEKNNAKTSETHERVNGMIVKRGKHG